MLPTSYATVHATPRFGIKTNISINHSLSDVPNTDNFYTALDQTLKTYTPQLEAIEPKDGHLAINITVGENLTAVASQNYTDLEKQVIPLPLSDETTIQETLNQAFAKILSYAKGLQNKVSYSTQLQELDAVIGKLEYYASAESVKRTFNPGGIPAHYRAFLSEQSSRNWVQLDRFKNNDKEGVYLYLFQLVQKNGVKESLSFYKSIPTDPTQPSEILSPNSYGKSTKGKVSRDLERILQESPEYQPVLDALYQRLITLTDKLDEIARTQGIHI